MEYPLGLTNRGSTTWAHQLATIVLFNSPLQMISEDPHFLLNSKKIAPILPILRNIPTVWDETKVLQQSEIGQLEAIAKRSGNDWYIGILNDDHENQ
ncbi:MAG: hypothetical protein GZ086_02765 [Gelidibacter sp.]|nr:hypothetical protein [Gelidibacter sp.]